MPYTFEAAKHTARKVRQAQDYLEVPIAVENVSSYAEFHCSQMTEWEFLNEVVERADCGILLDVNNIYVSSKNHNFDPYRVSQQRPCGAGGANSHCRVIQSLKVHAGTHDHPVIDPVWKLYDQAIRRDRPYGDSARMGRPYSVLRKGACRSAQGRKVH